MTRITTSRSSNFDLLRKSETAKPLTDHTQTDVLLPKDLLVIVRGHIFGTSFSHFTEKFDFHTPDLHDVAFMQPVRAQSLQLLFLSLDDKHSSVPTLTVPIFPRHQSLAT